MDNILSAPKLDAGRRGVRRLDVMLGLCRGVLADGVVAEAEAQILRAWMAANPDVTRTWPGNVLAARLERIYFDGRVDEEERRDLADLLQQLVGAPVAVTDARTPPPALPLDRPPPTLSFTGRLYTFTGTFAYGSRTRLERAVLERGGTCEPGVTRCTNVLVVGTFAGHDWARRPYGASIRKAAAFRARGVPISIVAEDHWVAHL